MVKKYVEIIRTEIYSFFSSFILQIFFECLLCVSTIPDPGYRKVLAL